MSEDDNTATPQDERRTTAKRHLRCESSLTKLFETPFRTIMCCLVVHLTVKISTRAASRVGVDDK